jgi:hypothetical protein
MEKGRTRAVGRIGPLSSQIRPDGAVDAMQIPARIYHRKSQKKDKADPDREEAVLSPSFNI